MNVKLRTIEVDAATADALTVRAAERGMSVGELVAELVTFADTQPAADGHEIADLDRQWAAIEAGEPTVPHDQVVRWLETWGTRAFKPWRER
jgi:predicted transcriptional regulator